MNDLVQLAALVKRRNEIEAEITAITNRPALIGHVGEYIAARIFNVALEASASNKTIDGRFQDGPLALHSVNIKWYGKREGLLDLTPSLLPDFYLVMTGPVARTLTSLGSSRPWLIHAVYLFNAAELVAQLQARGLRLGVATSVRQQFWQEAEIYPTQRSNLLVLSERQRYLLSLFGENPRTR